MKEIAKKLTFMSDIHPEYNEVVIKNDILTQKETLNTI